MSVLHQIGELKMKTIHHNLSCSVMRYFNLCMRKFSSKKLNNTCRQYTQASSIRFNEKDLSSVFSNNETSKKVKSQSPKELLDKSASFVDAEAESPDELWSTAPYPKGCSWKQSQARYSFRPNIDPQETSVMLFPGQGSQFVGMVKPLVTYPNVKEMFDIASEILGYDLLALCQTGPKEQLEQTKYCQPAILVTSLAAIEKLKAENPAAVESCVAAAGFSVGELTALTFAGAFSFEDAVKLAKVRGEAMQLASQLTPSGMMTVFFSPSARISFACHVARQWCVRRGLSHVDCRISNYLFPQCKVIAGNNEALDFIKQNASDFKIYKTKRLSVSGAFHTSLMSPAVEVFKEALLQVEVDAPLIPTHSNVDGRPHRGPDDVRRTLVKQITSPVRWEQTLHILYERNPDTNYPKTYECGPGTSLKTILKMVNNKAFGDCSSVMA